MSAGPLLRAAVTALLLVTYSVAVHLTTASAQPSDLGAAVAVLPPLGFGLLLAWRATHRRRWLAVWSLVAAATALGWPQLRSGFAWIYLLQHAGSFALLALLFGSTLRRGELALISRVHQLVHGQLPPLAARYTRGVTQAWALFCTAMTLTSLALFALGPRESWSLFANALTPVLVIALFAAEYLLRVCLLPASMRSGLLDSIRAFRRLGDAGATTQASQP